MKKRYNILICPLEWGLGHAARMIPVASYLSNLGHNVIIASGEEHLSLFRNELPGLSYINFPGFKPSYSRFFPQYLSLLFKIPGLLFHIAREHNRLKSIITGNEIDAVISDNRFGLWNRKIITVYVTHMPRIPFPFPFRFLEPVGIALHRLIIKRYNHCWIPDLPGEENISGRLSHSVVLTSNTRFTGLLSKFSVILPDHVDYDEETRHNTVVLSGPEPQKGILKKKLVTILKNRKENTFILEGKPLAGKQLSGNGNIHFYSHLPAGEMAQLLWGSRCVVARSGYTTIMELISLQTGALLIPTPGQTEQEYLAEYLSGKGWFSTVSQSKLDDTIKLPDVKAIWPSRISTESKNLLTEAINELLIDLHENQETCKSG